jgi:hypothetical protein
MGLKKIVRQLESYIEDKVDVAYLNGYESGSEDALVCHEVGFAEGVQAERDRVIGLFTMLAQQELLNGSGSKAKAYADAAETVRVANVFEQQDWSEEGIARAYQKDLENDGF